MMTIETAWQDTTQWTYEILVDEDIYWQEWRRRTETETFSWDCGTWMKEQRIKISVFHREAYSSYLATGKRSKEQHRDEMTWQVWQGDWNNNNWVEVSFYDRIEKRELNWDIQGRLTLDKDLNLTRNDSFTPFTNNGYHYHYIYNIPEAPLGIRLKSGIEWVNGNSVLVHELEQWIA